MSKKIKNFVVILDVIISLITISYSYAKNDSTSVGYTKLTVNETLNPNGQTTIELPSYFKDEKIDGIVFENNGKGTTVKTSVKDNILTVTTVNDLLPNATYDIKIFTRSGEKYKVTVKAEEKIQINAHQDNTIRVSANPSEGFNFPYYLYIPQNAFNKSEKSYMVVEGNNSYVSDTFQVHEEYIQFLIGASNGPRYFAENLNTPLLVPAFPRVFDFMNEPYIQFLDRKSLLTENEQMKRADLQLTAMIKHAQKLLKKYGINIEDKVFLTGYSASAKFAQRYATLQPHMVKAIAVGGIAGTTILPLESYKGVKLRYPVGIADFKELTGSNFNAEEYKKIAQYLYMGEYDYNDATQYIDCYDEEDAQTIWKLLGTHQIKDNRLHNTVRAMTEGGFGDSVQYHIYKNVGHQISDNANNDVIEFFKANSGEVFKKITPHEYGN